MSAAAKLPTVDVNTTSAVFFGCSLVVAFCLPAFLSYLRKLLLLLRIPSPPVSSFIAGHAPQLTSLRRHRYEQKWIESINSTVFRLRTFHKHRVVIADPFLLREIFAAEREGLVEKPDAPPFHAGKGKEEFNVFSDKTGSPMWKVVRKGTVPAFQPVNMRHYHAHIVTIVQRLVDAIIAKGEGAVVDFSDIGQRESFDVIGLVGFGKDFQASRDIDNSVSNNFRLLQTFLVEATKRAGNPLRKFSRAPDVLEAEAEKQKLRGILRDLVIQCQGRLPDQAAAAAEAHPSISGRLLSLRDPQGRPLSDARLLEEFFIFFLAGAETTGHTIAWTLYFLAKHPKVMAKLEKELDDAGLLVTSSNPKPRSFEYADVGKLRYLDCVIKESMRLQPVAATPLSRIAVRDLQLSNGIIIPAGTAIETAQYAPMRDPRWGWKDGDKFDPERWEEPDVEYVHGSYAASDLLRKAAAKNGEEDLEIDAQVASDTKARRFNPFGQGIRNCLGQQLARTNVPTAVAMFVSHLKMQLTAEDDRKTLEELEIVRGTLQPAEGIHMTCIPRSRCHPEE